jgi:hypothetical protein
MGATKFITVMPGSSVADPDRFGPDPDPTSENRPDPVKTGSGFI